jgi:hypothetical protein
MCVCKKVGNITTLEAIHVSKLTYLCKRVEQRVKKVHTFTCFTKLKVSFGVNGHKIRLPSLLSALMYSVCYFYENVKEVDNITHL